jgi:hypothetical protein
MNLQKSMHAFKMLGVKRWQPLCWRSSHQLTWSLPYKRSGQYNSCAANNSKQQPSTCCHLHELQYSKQAGLPH